MNLYKINPSDKARQFMKMCGVPNGLLSPFTLDLTKLLVPFNHGNKTVKVISRSQQLNCWQFLQTKFSPYVLIIASVDNYLQARQLATILLWRNLLNSLNHSKTSALPVWHNPAGQYPNQLLLDYHNGKYREPSLLVLDNVYTDMSSHKRDKVSDILQTMNDRPQVIIFRGDDPNGYCTEQLGIKPNYRLQLGRTSNKSNILKI